MPKLVTIYDVDEEASRAVMVAEIESVVLNRGGYGNLILKSGKIVRTRTTFQTLVDIINDITVIG